MPTRRLILSLAAGIAALAACGPKNQGGSKQGQMAAAIGGPFTLVDQDGKTVTQEDLKGHWSAIYFGFTYCPDVCPTSLMALADGLEQVPQGDKVQTYLISVDPGRDTPAAMKAYIANPEFPKGLKGLTGTPEQVAQTAKAYKVYFKKDGEGEGYLVQHQSIIFLMDPKGQFVRPLTHGLTPRQIADQVRDAMRRA